MAVERDPRSDPKPGDVLKRRAGNSLPRYVSRVTSCVSYRYGVAAFNREFSLSLGAWEKWAQKAVVIHAAD